MKRFSLGQVLIIVAAVFLIGGIVPSLLEAQSDISVLIGVMVVVSMFYGVVKYGKKIMKWTGFDFDEEDN